MRPGSRSYSAKEKKRQNWARLWACGVSSILLSFLCLPPVSAQESLQKEINLKYFDLTEGRIAFTYTKGKQRDIYVIDFGTLIVEPLVATPALDEFPSWSPDGQKLAFYSDASGDREIYVINADGTELTQLTDSQGPDEDPSWSPDGSQIVFHSARAGSGSDLYVMNADGSNQRPLGAKRNKAASRNTLPKWSPRGTEILYTTNESWPGWDLALYDLKTQKSKILTTGRHSFFRGSWHPAGGAFVFSYGSGTLIDIWEHRKGGKKLVPLFTRPGRDYDAVWTDDGKRLFFVGEIEAGKENFQLFVWDKEKDKMEQVTNALGSIRHPAWTTLPTLSSIKERTRKRIEDRQ